MVPLNILQNSQENTCVGVSFLKIPGLRAATLLKRGSSTGLFQGILQKILRPYFVEHLQTGASGIFY